MHDFRKIQEKLKRKYYDRQYLSLKVLKHTFLMSATCMCKLTTVYIPVTHYEYNLNLLANALYVKSFYTTEYSRAKSTVILNVGLLSWKNGPLTSQIVYQILFISLLLGRYVSHNFF